MNQPASNGMAAQMPHTARWVADMRKQHGAVHVDGCLRAAMRGERNQFYAVEGGHVVGAPFDWTDKGLFIVSMSILAGGPFVAAIREPQGGMALTVPRPGGAA